jgi:tRNA (uracil-5-)-methyltransferase TRM9
MKLELADRLNQINREFYSTFAASFSETRASLHELQVILPYIADGARVLDIGCGNGRAAAMLARERRGIKYVGVDSSAEQISDLKSQISNENGIEVQSRVVDITQPDWTGDLLLPKAGEVGKGAFDCILLLAVLHHIPGRDVRVRIVHQVRELLAPQGRVVISTWQFMDSERMRKKIVPWNLIGVDERELEPGDALLSWKRGGMGLRYCHWIGEKELRQLAVEANLEIVETFRAGGREGNLSLYAILSA